MSEISCYIFRGVEFVMERTMHSWSRKDVEALYSTLGSQGFGVTKSAFPKPEIKIAFKERIGVMADKCKASLDPYAVLLECGDVPTERDINLERLLEKEYPHKYSFETAVLYPALLAFAIAAIVYPR